MKKKLALFAAIYLAIFFLLMAASLLLVSQKKERAKKIFKREELTEGEFLKAIASPLNPGNYSRALNFALKQGYKDFKKAYQGQTEKSIATFGTFSSANWGEVTLTNIVTSDHQISYLTKLQKVDQEIILTLFDADTLYSFNLSKINQGEKPQKKKSSWIKNLIPQVQALGFTQESTGALISAPGVITNTSNLSNIDPDCLGEEIQRRIREVMLSPVCQNCLIFFDCEDCEAAIQEVLSEAINEVGSENLQDCRYPCDLIVASLYFEQPIEDQPISVRANVTYNGGETTLPNTYNARWRVYDEQGVRVDYGSGGGSQNYQLFRDDFEIDSLLSGLYRLTYEITEVFPASLNENSTNNFYEGYFYVLPPNNQPPELSLTIEPNPAALHPRQSDEGEYMSVLVNFSGSCQDSDGLPFFYLIDYGDGYAERPRALDAQNPVFSQGHVYTQPGFYEVTASCQDDAHYWTHDFQTLIVDHPNPPANQPPQATIDYFYPNPARQKTWAEGIEAYWISFRGFGRDPDGQILVDQFEWTFGDGTRETGYNSAFHAYYQPGTYTIGLRVKDNRGRWSDWAAAFLNILPEEETPSSPTATASPLPTPTPIPSTPAVLNASFLPEIVAQGEEQKLILEIKNDSGKVLLIEGARIDWYWDPGSGFYLAEQQNISGADPHWSTTKVPAYSTESVYFESSKASGAGLWRGEIMVFTNLGDLRANVSHRIK